MASNILITRREYTNQFRAETTSWLLGNVGDIITLEIDTEVTIESVSSQSNPFTSNGIDEFTRATGNFQAEGHSVGSTIAWNVDVTTSGIPANYSGTGTITVLNPTFMRVTVVSGTFPPSFDYPFGNSSVTTSELGIFSTDQIDAVVFNYNFISNSDLSTNSLNSLVDGTIPTFKATGINPNNTSTLVPLIPLSFNSGISLLFANIKGAGVSGYVQKFTTSIQFQIMPLFEDFSDFQNLKAPTFLFGAESLTDVFSFKFLPQIANPNISLSVDSSNVAQLGNVGWFDENYNGNTSLYSKLGSSYTTTSGSSVSAIQLNDTTNFIYEINQPNNSATSKYKMGFAFVPVDKTLLENKNKYNYENILYNGLGIAPLDQSTTSSFFVGAENTFGAKMDIQFDSITANGNTVTIKGQFIPNAKFEAYLKTINTDDWNYIVWISCADESLATTVSDRVSVLVDSNQFIEKALSFVSGDVSIDFLNHAQQPINVASPTYLGALEDEISSKSLMYLDTSKTETVNEITFLVEGFNIVTNQSFIAETYTVDTSNFLTDINGVQQISFDSNRGFQMLPTVDKNIIKISREPSEDIGTKKAYLMFYPFRYRWEYWIQNNLVPTDLIDGTKVFDGQNQNWYRLSSFQSNWKFRFSIQTKLNSSSKVLNTKNNTNLFIRNYEESTVWDGEITHFDETGATNLFVGLDANGIRQNAILDQDKTLIQADFDLENLAGNVGSISNYYGVIRIEKFENGGINGIEMLSSVLDNENNILKPVSGETKCKIEKISNTKIRLTGLIDNNFLDLSSKYKTSARIGYKNLSFPGIYGQQYGSQYA